MPAVTTERKLGPFFLMPGITRINGLSYFITAMIAVPMMAALSFLQPIMLRLVGVERAVQGTLSGDLVFYQEIIVLVTTPFIGALADKVGRRPLVMLGVALLGIGYALYPFADSVFNMYAYRTVFGFGVAIVATSITIVNTDYVQDKSRGKWVALAGLTQGIGIFVVSQLLRTLPVKMASEGRSEQDIAFVLFWGCTATCITLFVIAATGLSRSKPPEARERDSVMELVRAGINAARKNSRVALAYATAFAARGDVLVFGTFTFLWTQQAAEDLGLGMAEGYKRGGMVVGIISISALLWALIMGWMLDRIDRVTGVIVAFTLAAIGYTAFGLMDDPFSNRIILPAVLVGMGEISTIIAGNALIGQSAPAAVRGAVLGSYALCGALGILIATSIGGRVFDLLAPGAPFVQMGIINALVLVGAIYVRRWGKPAPN
ncbi:MAG: MFS transporter [Gammaproteobacteria bacterium]|jgi:MFS family permease|nr:MFS transporter [Gammaproteobacteria bacterium]MDP6616799.1 MFS transporter [Gammaproteobacteria bacterium]MDP6696013.1 MFS transporter [Gammaproteobacteria bacterium]MDP7042044.1 MFS transporter [Gammaproteobacteria bacterium]